MAVGAPGGLGGHLNDAVGVQARLEWLDELVVLPGRDRGTRAGCSSWLEVRVQVVLLG